MTQPKRSLSIRARLAVIYTGLLAAALVVFGAGVFLILGAELKHSLDDSIRANAEHAAGAFVQDVDGTGVLRPSYRLVEQLASTGGRVVVLDADGVVIADSAAAGTSPLPVTSAELRAADRHANVVQDANGSGGSIRMTVEPVLVGGSAVGYVAWADATGPLGEVLRTVGSALVLGGSALVAIALAGGFVLARRALAPVADVTDTARAIALSGDFAARVESGAAGDEVAELAVAFNEMLAALQQNHQALQGFLGDVSHQLRTPLTTIRANLELATREGVPDQERRAILADARDEAERMGRQIGDLLSLARAEAGARLEFAPVELDALLVQSVRRQHQVAPGIRMSVSNVHPAVVEGDSDRLGELFGILLDNAARYTPAGGTVSAGIHVEDGCAVVLIEDTGIGLDPDEQERIFERLYRGRRARQLRPSGTGLGLAIARWIVDAHGGAVELHNRPGGGAVATVTLPLRSI